MSSALGCADCLDIAVIKELLVSALAKTEKRFLCGHSQFDEVSDEVRDEVTSPMNLQMCKSLEIKKGISRFRGRIHAVS